jgi:hypothetical protein
MVLTVTLAALLAQAPAQAPKAPDAAKQFALRPAVTRTIETATKATKDIALDLHPMTEDEKRLYPGRERFDKTEWYESLFKSMKIVLLPEHVDEWNNGGREVS